MVTEVGRDLSDLSHLSRLADRRDLRVRAGADHHYRGAASTRPRTRCPRRPRTTPGSRSPGPSFRFSSWSPSRSRPSAFCGCSSIIPQPDVVVKATGYAWYWGYEYPADQGGGFKFDFEHGRRQGPEAGSTAPADCRQRDGGSGEQDHQGSGHRRRRAALVRDAVLRHQGRRRPRPPERDLVPGRERRRLSRTMLGALRQRAPLHADHHPGGQRAAIRRLADRGEAEIRFARTARPRTSSRPHSNLQEGPQRSHHGTCS